MPILPENIDYTDLDFDSINLRFDRLLQSVFPTWTDYNRANFGNVLKEMNSWISDVLAFYLNAQARESRATLANQRRNVISHFKFINYSLGTADAALADEVFTLASVPTHDVVIPAGTAVKTEGVGSQIPFQLLQPLTITAGDNPPEATGAVENSETVSASYLATRVPFQEFYLDDGPYLDGSAIVLAGNGVYNKVDNFLNSGPADRNFVVLVDQNDRATVRVGDGVNGALPLGTVFIAWKKGGGMAGNVEANTIKVIEGSFVDSIDNRVSVTVNNPVEASGGKNRETIAEARILGPESIRVVNRTVTREDFEIGARAVSGVARALMLTSNELAAIDENAGKLYVVPSGGGVPTTALKEQIAAYFVTEKPKTITFSLDVVNPQYKDIDVKATVHLTSGSDALRVKAIIEATLDAYFLVSNADNTPNRNVNFGYNWKDVDGNPIPEVVWGDVRDVVKHAAGVRKVGDPPDGFLLNSLPHDVAMEIYEFPRLGTVSLIDGSTGEELGV